MAAGVSTTRGLRPIGGRAIRSLQSDRELASEMQGLARRLAALGVFNMLLSDGRSLFCTYGTRLASLKRRAPFGPATLIDQDLTANFEQETTPNDVVTVVATGPLTRDEAWQVMQPGSFVVFRQGERRPVTWHRTVARQELAA